MYKATHVKGQGDLFAVLTFKKFSWDDSTLHCNYVLPLRKALGAKRENKLRQRMDCQMTEIFPDRKKAAWGQQGYRGSEQQAEQGSRLERPQLVSVALSVTGGLNGILLSLPWDALLPCSHILASSALSFRCCCCTPWYGLFSGLAAAAKAWKEFSSW